ncbi:hypothetical protein IWX46DRAFT_577170 [Phyllosticta citricarpa]|uniref:Uncharacterized protein n=1 Tax=Phyllosticta citricarpa TaxID=55181 RepID=A0ABR1MRG3_9PEZI
MAHESTHTTGRSGPSKRRRDPRGLPEVGRYAVRRPAAARSLAASFILIITGGRHPGGRKRCKAVEVKVHKKEAGCGWVSTAMLAILTAMSPVDVSERKGMNVGYDQRRMSLGGTDGRTVVGPPHLTRRRTP